MRGLRRQGGAPRYGLPVLLPGNGFFLISVAVFRATFLTTRGFVPLTVRVLSGFRIVLSE